MQQLNIQNFKSGILLSILMSAFLFIVNAMIGKADFFLLLNDNLGKAADGIFVFFTFLGDGLWWIIILLLFIFFRRRFLPLLLFSFVFSEIFIEMFKSVLIPNEPRPIKAIADTSLIHTVSGVEMHAVGSFPSGHTTQGFVFFLLACLMIDRKWIVTVGFFYAVLIGYSRIYLAQHFPRDVAGGMLFASISVLLSVCIYQQWFNPINKKALQ
jgi:membrane-associated phospholipid phosphatase